MRLYRLPVLSVSSLAAIVSLLSSCATYACDERLVAISIQDGKPEVAFELLKACEARESTSADALLLLASFYEDDDFNPDNDRRDRVAKAWELIERAALMGDVDAIDTLAMVYSTGSEELGVEPEFKVADCLLAITESNENAISPDNYDPDAVRACLVAP